MPSFSRTLDLYLDTTGPLYPARFLIGRASGTASPGTPLTLVQGDVLKLRLWLLRPVAGVGQSAECLTQDGSIILALKKSKSDPAYLTLAEDFAFVADAEKGDHYEATLNAATDEIDSAFGTAAAINAFFDIELRNTANTERITYQQAAMVTRQVYSGGLPPNHSEPPYPSSSELRGSLSTERSARAAADLALSQRLDDQLASLVSVTPFALTWANNPFAGALGTGPLTDFSATGNLFEGTIPGDAANYMCGASLTGFPAGARLRLTGTWTTDGLVGGNPGFGVFDAAGNNLNPVWISENTTGALLACECELPAGAAWLVAARVPDAGAGNPTAGTFGVSELDCDALNAPTLAESLDAKADKISGGTAGNVVIRDAGGNIEDSGYSISSPNTFAGDDQLVVGSDPRLQIKSAFRLNGGALTCPRLTTLPDSGTVSLLVRLDDAGTPQCLFGNHYPEIGYGNMEVSIEADGRLRVAVGNGDGSGKIQRTLPPGTISYGAWHRVAFTYSPGALSVYVDGVPISGTLDENAYTGFVALAFGNLLRFGAFYGSFPYYMAGEISEAFYSSALLTVDEIKRSYRRDFSPATLASMEFNVRASTALPSGTWPDSSPKCRDFVPTGSVVVLSDCPSFTRRIATTCSGSGAIAANDSASVGTLTGISGADTAAIAAIRAGDSVTAQFGASMPAHIVSLIANAPSAGAPIVRAHADATGDTVPAATAINLIHTLS